MAENVNSDKTITLILCGLLIFGVGYFLLRKQPVISSGYVKTSTMNPGKEELMAAGGKRYINEERWDILWSADGLPTSVTIHRDAVQK